MLEEKGNRILDFYEKNKRMPSYAEAAVLFGFKSKDSAFKLIQKLISKGILDRDKKGKLIPKNNFTEKKTAPFKLLGLIEAGFPTHAEETDLDHITLDDWLTPNKSASFILKVKGDSMKDAGIIAGDYVIVERTNSASTGSIVIAEIDGAWTMKYLRKDKSGYYLEPANKAFNIIRPKEDLSINAVVKAVVRKYT